MSTVYWELGQSRERSLCRLEEQGGHWETTTLAKAAPLWRREEEHGGQEAL